MPYQSNNQLPEAVRNSLDEGQQNKWREVFNSAYEGTCNGDDGCAARVAWSQMKKHARWFAGWASVEVVDRQNDIVPIDAISKAMEDFMALGGTLIDIHTNRKIGAYIDYAIKDKVGKPGLWVEAVIYKRYRIHDIAWYKIKNKDYTGLSIGADPISRGRECDSSGERCWNVIKAMQLFEISTVDDPANQEAMIEQVNTMAKGAIRINFINKSLATPNNTEDKVNSCPLLKSYLEHLTKSGMPEVDAISEIEMQLEELKEFKELKAKGGEITVNEPAAPGAGGTGQGTPAPANAPAGAQPTVSKDANPTEMLQQIATDLGDLKKRIAALEGSLKPPAAQPPASQGIETQTTKATTVSVEDIVKGVTREIIPAVQTMIKTELQAMAATKPTDTPRPGIMKGDETLPGKVEALLKDKRKLASMSIIDIDAMVAGTPGEQ